jgi:hypothetical protein
MISDLALPAVVRVPGEATVAGPAQVPDSPPPIFRQPESQSSGARPSRIPALRGSRAACPVRGRRLVAAGIVKATTTAPMRAERITAISKKFALNESEAHAAPRARSIVHAKIGGARDSPARGCVVTTTAAAFPKRTMPPPISDASAAETGSGNNPLPAARVQKAHGNLALLSPEGGVVPPPWQMVKLSVSLLA